MSTEPFDAELIERYLLSRGRRYFRGHHDAEYFFILTVGHDRLHVHLEIPPADPHVFTIRVMPANFYPAGDRLRLQTFTDDWNRQDRQVKATMFESCDQSRIGVVAENSYPFAASMRFDEFAEFADSTITSAVILFTEMTPTPALKDAG